MPTPTLPDNVDTPQTLVKLVPSTGRMMNIRQISAIWNDKHVIGNLAELRDGSIIPQSQRRLELNVLSLQGNGFTWGVYHREPKASVECMRLTSDMPERSTRAPDLTPALVLKKGVEVSVYHHKLHSLFIETLPDHNGETFCYQVLDQSMLREMLMLYNARLCLSRTAAQLHFIRIDYGELDDAIESGVNTLLHTREGLLSLLPLVEGALNQKTDVDLLTADVGTLRQALSALYTAATT